MFKFLLVLGSLMMASSAYADSSKDYKVEWSTWIVNLDEKRDFTKAPPWDYSVFNDKVLEVGFDWHCQIKFEPQFDRLSERGAIFCKYVLSPSIVVATNIHCIKGDEFARSNIGQKSRNKLILTLHDGSQRFLFIRCKVEKKEKSK